LTLALVGTQKIHATYFMTFYAGDAFLKLQLIIVCSTVAADFRCPAKDGQYEDERQCDKYYECEDGVAKEKLCPDGLVFDPTIRKLNKCDQPFSIDCGDRTELRKSLKISKILQLGQN